MSTLSLGTLHVYAMSIMMWVAACCQMFFPAFVAPSISIGSSPPVDNLLTSDLAPPVLPIVMGKAYLSH
ncbi:hypothetical protein EDD18DRAFT_1365347 [Armillaria luteobubalina]|uniref:Uncharacterized protein n=1 Tax=Armillaria luteobubalina TaxID=153913 RepID=A0AA39P504_9AGAR|nr:hypothetical protein EDD18DRAFT_1365347 [Armillaria luteobubalina]